MAGKRYQRTGTGPWLEVPINGASPDLASQLRSSAEGSLTDSGTEERDGQTVHRLVPGAGSAFDPAAILSSTTGVTDVTAELVFLVTENGLPVGATIEITWTQAVANAFVQASLSFELKFNQVGFPQLILKPRDVLVVYKSRDFDYSLAHPEPWFENPGKDEDSFTIVSTDVGGTDIFLGGSRLIIDRYPLPSGKLSDAVRAVVSAREKELGGKATMEDIEVAGRPAVLVTSSGIAGVFPLTAYDVIVVRGKTFYDLLWVADMSGMVMDELAIFRELLTTFEFT